MPFRKRPSKSTKSMDPNIRRDQISAREASILESLSKKAPYRKSLAPATKAKPARVQGKEHEADYLAIRKAFDDLRKQTQASTEQLNALKKQFEIMENLPRYMKIPATIYEDPLP